MMPCVSVIIATRNRPELLPRAVESAFAAGTEVEVVVVDDASAEETARVCRGLERITYVRADHHQGLGGARNLGIVASSGAYISFLDDDDIRLPGSLDAQVQVLEKSPAAGIAYGQALIGDQNGIPTGRFYPALCPQGDLFWELLETNFIPCPSIVFRKSCLHRVGLLNETLPAAEDWDICIRIAELYECVAVSQPVAIWREPTPDSGQYTSRAAEIHSLCACLFAERWMMLPRAKMADPLQRQETRRRFNERLSDQLIWETFRTLRARRPVRAGKSLLFSLRLNPSRVLARILHYSMLRLKQATGSK